MRSFRMSCNAFRSRVGAAYVATNVLACTGLNAADVVPWKVVPDATRIALKIPARSGSLGVPAGAAGTAIYPSTTSPFVVISNHGQGAQLWNLETSKAIGGMFGHVDDPAATLSPDGQWMVAEHFENGQRYSAVWSTKTGQRTWTAPQPHHISPPRFRWRDGDRRGDRQEHLDLGLSQQAKGPRNRGGNVILWSAALQSHAEVSRPPRIQWSANL